MSGIRFTAEQEAMIRQHFPHKFTAEVAAMIGRTATATAQKAALMGVKKTPEFLKANCRIKPGQVIAPETQFKKGFTPFNKGKKQSEFLSPEAIEKTKASRFQKGQKPKNTLHDGAISTRTKRTTGESYKFIRIAAGKWELYHRWIWEQANGKIPKGHLVVFINGDTMDCRLENLKLITMAENAIRNSGSISLSDGYVAKCIAGKNPELQKHLIKHHPEIIETAKLNYQLNRKIKEYEKQTDRPR